MAAYSLSLSIILVICNSAQQDPFLWGTATAAYQIEGGITQDGRLPSIWDTFCDETNKVHNHESAKIADDDYNRWKEDIQLMKALNLSNYRFSIAWPRILPDGHTVNQVGLDHYRKIITTLLANDITPFITLYHWDLPQQVFDETNGGWISSDIIPYWLRYVDIVFNAYHDLVKRWVTFNEPWTFCVQGYDIGSHAPGRCSNRDYCAKGNSSTEPYLCTHNVLLSHAAAVKLFRENGYAVEGGEIGMTITVDWAEPASDSEEDKQAAQTDLLFKSGWYADPLWFGDYPQIMKDYVGDRLPTFTEQQQYDLKGSHDFFALNHYTTQWVIPLPTDKDVSASDTDWYSDQRVSGEAYNPHNGTVIGVQAASDWLYVVPWGIYKVLHWIADRYDNPPIFITENGVDIPSENDMTHDEVLNDTFRVNFYSGYIGYALQARSEGVDLRSYIAWSLMDNFEWAQGYSKRFGLHFVNYTANNTRYQKESAKWYAKYSQNNPRGDYKVHLKLTQQA